MSYAYDQLAEAAVRLLQQRPALRLEEIADRLRVHRHTLHQALAACGGDFASLKRSAVLRRLAQSFETAEPFKDVWARSGFSSASAFARYIRHATGRTPSRLRAEYVSGQLGPELARMGLDLRGGAEITWASIQHQEVLL